MASDESNTTSPTGAVAERVSPRAAGWIAVGVAVVIAVGGGVLLAHPPWSITGAVVLVGASILLPVGAVWMLRRSWSEPWPPDLTPSVQKQLRWLRVGRIASAVMLVGVIALAIYAVARQNWWQLAWAGVLGAMGLSNLSVNRATLRRLLESRAATDGE
ncbi:hypothetical protein SCB71_15865 [Herbiconiux sp. KACC 21604]|uniref:hypothetical protein n=1 Tax=unclassified Herbiconiux TaxID=2618217 RepID=UPI00149138D3|nr:hypothetical protein [Herbiconiux sp. SALV-R1]QJU54596.1 hypothetical protein HL652_13815 [Herbiconiux sp. SALV-R1]WPO85682.1 hypothetical protein SCB71_15865 [Herbiconiux sp. KACC 21604]